MSRSTDLNNQPAASKESLILQKFIGIDFGVPRRAGDQAKKIIAIEAVKRSKSTYAILPGGRNQRLVGLNGAPTAPWRHRRPGWTIDQLRDSLCADSTVRAAAFDIPFSIPRELLCDARFANAVGVKEAFGTRAVWQSFIAQVFPLVFDGDKAGSEMIGWQRFDPWRRREYWISRRTDKSTQASPPLKDKFQSVFNMTIAGASLLNSMAKSGYQEKIADLEPGRAVMETYPRAVAAALGFAGSYKQQPLECLETVLEALGARGVKLDFDRAVKKFCETYVTGGNDHDGVDAFLCLATAICFDQGQATFCGKVVLQEGAIITPTARPKSTT